MCTVSWLFNSDGYQLFFNRDELKSRQRAEPPAVKIFQQTQVISPTDTDAGGTWITVNEHGLTLCLLNNYAAQATQATQATIENRNWISRGLLVQDFSHFADTTTLLAQLKSTKLNNYRPFDLVILSPNRHALQLCWNGFELQITKRPIMPLTSSSFATDEVINRRLQLFNNTLNRQTLIPEQLQQYHASHAPQAGAFSVCMHRDNGQTVSFSRICVDRSQVSFDYFDGPPCCTNEAHNTQLALQASALPQVADNITCQYSAFSAAQEK